MCGSTVLVAVLLAAAPAHAASNGTASYAAGNGAAKGPARVGHNGTAIGRALQSDADQGTVFAFGYMEYGQLGLGYIQHTQLSPVQVTALGSDCAMVAAVVLLKEKADVKAMHDHTHGDEGQARQSHQDADRTTFENPLQE
jgi:hypothetical protein